MATSSTRRKFLKTAAAGTAISMTAASYARVKGANERISIAQIGCGGRGVGAHMKGIHEHDKAQNVEITAVCDPWRLRREEAAALAKEWYGREARKFVSYRDVVALDDIDAVMIASCDHQHTTHLEAAAKAKKDVYCEKPLARNMKTLNAALDAVRENNVVFQAGTQLRSMPSMRGCRKLYGTGILGTVGRIEQCRNGDKPFWYTWMKEVKEEDVDWGEFLMDQPMRPFDPVLYSSWYGYREFCDGPVPQLGVHFMDLVHYITGASLPANAVCLGGTYTWIDDYKFTCPDHVQALWTYPEGFMVSYSTNFGNSAGKSFKIFGDQGLLDIVNWNAPMLTAEGGSKNRGVIRGENRVEDIEGPDHFLDWLQCIRSRGTTNANVDVGFQQTVTVLMGVRAFDTGLRQVYDPKTREICPG